MNGWAVQASAVFDIRPPTPDEQEQSWLAGTDPDRLLALVLGPGSRRKMRLYAVACCRRVDRLLADEPARHALAVAERWADGRAPQREVSRARAAVRGYPSATFGAAAHAALAADAGTAAVYAPRYAVAAAAEEAARAAVADPTLDPNTEPSRYQSRQGQAQAETWLAERARQCELVREVFGNPFRPAAIDPRWLAWNRGCSVPLARDAYDGRRFADLPVLADALEEAGCADAELLDHLRGCGPHVRGCWALDAVLGRG